MLKYNNIQNLNQLYHAVQQLFAFSLKELDPKMMLDEASSLFQQILK